MLAAAADFLKLDPGVFVWTLVTFVLLLLALWKWAWGPLTAALDAREKRIQGRFDEAARKLDEAAARLAAYQARLDGAKAEVAALLARGRSDAEHLRDEITAAARREAEKVHERARREIELAKDQAADELRSSFAGLSTEIAARIIGRALDPADHRRLVEECLAELEKK